MTSIYYHFLWFLFLLLSFILMSTFSLYILYIDQVFYLSLNFLSFWNNDVSLSFYFDYMSSCFSSVILLISSVIMVYSVNYIMPYSKSVYFLWLTNLFILSMLIVVNMSNLFFLILGWDGLGLVSFFLIVYYQNQSSITSGVFTLLINRLGDSFFLVTIVLFFYSFSDLFPFSSNLSHFLTLVFLVLTFITNSAIFPFSPWLPLAIAAPTPISALVHSSTLVTSGLYLIIRFSYLIYSSYYLLISLLFLSVFTSFYAGMNAIVENDLNKLIALSTLSHLGFIGIAFSSGLLNLAFFHMLTHALFKSLLFITIGDIMINLNHSQDIRYLSSGMSYTPISCMIMYVSLFNLLGLPTLSGFFSNDLVLELINYSNSSFVLISLIFVNVIFTYYYTYQLFYYSFQSNNLFPYQNFHSPMLIHSVLLFTMSISTLLFGWFFLSHICSFTLFYPVPFFLKWFPPFANVIFFMILFSNNKLFTFTGFYSNYYFSNMMFLSNIMLTLSSNLYYNLGFYIVNSVEYGLLNYSLNSYTSSSAFSLSKFLINLSINSPLKLVLFSSSFLFLLFLFSFLLNNISLLYMTVTHNISISI